MSIQEERMPPVPPGFSVLMPSWLLTCDYCDNFSLPLHDALRGWPLFLDAANLHWRTAHPDMDPEIDKPPWCSDGCWGKL